RNPERGMALGSLAGMADHRIAQQPGAAFEISGTGVYPFDEAIVVFKIKQDRVVQLDALLGNAKRMDDDLAGCVSLSQPEAARGNGKRRTAAAQYLGLDRLIARQHGG